jgi:hypothetical protein
MWTKTPPSRPGIYWWKYGFDGRTIARPVRIIEMPTGLFVTFFGSEQVEKPGQTPGEYWSVPLEPPPSDKPVDYSATYRDSLSPAK